MQIEDLLSVERISVDMTVGSRAEAIDALAGAFVKADPALSHETVVDALRARERLCSTNVGSGVAIPHARLSDIQGAQVAIAICREGIRFNEADAGDEPVQILVGLLSQEGKPRASLGALCTMANLLRSDDVRTRLRSASTPDAVMRALLDAADPADSLA